MDPTNGWPVFSRQSCGRIFAGLAVMDAGQVMLQDTADQVQSETIQTRLFRLFFFRE